MNIHKGNHKIRIADHKLPYANYLPLLHKVKRGRWGADAPPHPPAGGAKPPPRTPPYVTGHAPAAILGAAGRGLKWRDPIILYFHFAIKTRHVTAKGWRL